MPHDDPQVADALREAELRGLERALRAFPEPAMRRERLLERLESAPVEEAYALVRGIVRRPGGAAPQLPQLRETLQEVLRDGGATRRLDPELRARLEAQADRRDDAFVMRLFRATPAAQAPGERFSPLPRDVAELPLGMRRSLAKGVDLDLLERLLLDPDPVVVNHLLRNPRITEQHVIRIASRRPVHASSLEQVLKSARFGRRPGVRAALARNPYLPTRLAVQLLGVLPLAEVRAIADDGTLHPETRRHARTERFRREDHG